MSTINHPQPDPALASLNSMSPSEAAVELLKCCGSRRWAEQIAADRPFRSLDQLIESSDRVWRSLKASDWLEAFRSHPKIGEQKAAAPTAAEAQRWSADEQSGISNSAEQTLRDLARLNAEYEQKFGYIFIVCASGKSSEEMLAILRERLKNDTEEELCNAAAEQAKITELRLRKLLSGQ